ncbi:MAG: 3-deoxy-8-phosphooctulonate synthase [bacterium]
MTFANSLPVGFIAGPCVIESAAAFKSAAGRLKNIFSAAGVKFILKASFDKANRTSHKSSRGVGMETGLRLIKEIKDKLRLPVTADVHEPWQAAKVAKVADLLQIPAFLCRQTDLLLACADTGRAINVKKGQFLSPLDIVNAIRKIESRGNKSIMITERGTFFGYGDLVVDMRSLEIMKETGYPVIFDSTHSVQRPGGLGNATGGDIRFTPVLARAAAAIGIAGIFMEAHPDPAQALSDGPNSLDLKNVKKLVSIVRRIDRIVKKLPGK